MPRCRHWGTSPSQPCIVQQEEHLRPQWPRRHDACADFWGAKKNKRAPACPCLRRQEQGGMPMSRSWLKLGLWGGVALCLSAAGFTATTSEVNAQERVKWRMPSAFGSSLPHLGPSGVRFTKDVARMSGGKFDIKFFYPVSFFPF